MDSIGVEVRVEGKPFKTFDSCLSLAQWMQSTRTGFESLRISPSNLQPKNNEKVSSKNFLELIYVSRN